MPEGLKLMIRNLLKNEKEVENLVVIAIETILETPEASIKIGCVTKEELIILKQMINFKEPMKQLRIEKSYFDLTEEEHEEIALQIARNKGYEV